MRREVFFFTDSPGMGGAEAVLLDLMSGLDRRAWTPVLLHHPGPGLEPLVRAARAIDVESCPIAPMPDGVVGASRLPSFVNLLRNRRPAVFHANLSWPLACKFGLLGAVLARVPAVVASVHLVFDTFALDASIKGQQFILSRLVDRYLPVSAHVGERCAALLQWPKRRLQVVRNGIDVDRYAVQPNAALRSTLTCGRDRPVVLTHARLHAFKGHRYLLEALAQLPDVQGVLAGDGPELHTLKNLANELALGDRIAFLGFRSDIAELLAACDIFVLPSLYEGLPLSVLEAMAAGKPVVATDIGGTKEAVVEGQTGLLVPPADSMALAVAIRSLLADPDRGRAMGHAGREAARMRFTSSEMVQRIVSVYTDVLRHSA